MKKKKKRYTKNVGRVVESIKSTDAQLEDCGHVEITALRTVLRDAIDVIIKLSNAAAADSSNSSKPPSEDPHRSRKKGPGKKRKPGGQNGHKGCTLEPVENPTEVIELTLDTESLPPGDYTHSGFEARQVIEIEISTVVTEYQAEILTDQDGNEYVADFPPGVTERAQYGASVKAHSVYVSQYQLLPLGRVEEYFRDQMHLPLSKGSVFNWNLAAYTLLEPFEKWARNELMSSACNFADETGINLNGKNIWLHSLSNHSAVLFHADVKRGQEAMDRMGVLQNFHGVLVHDHWKPYFGYPCTHSLCNAHHLRELQAAIDFDDQDWAVQMHALLLEMNIAVKQAGGALSDDDVRLWKKRYEKILKNGEKECPINEKTRKQTKTRNLLTRLIKFENETLLFLSNPNVPFTNNQAENDIRMTKVQQKISGCFRSEQGAKIFCRVRSYLLTCQRHHVSASEALHLLFLNELPAFMLSA